MSMLKIKKGDTVKVIAGKDKGKEGTCAPARLTVPVHRVFFHVCMVDLARRCGDLRRG